MDFNEIIEQCKHGNRVAQGVLFNSWYRQAYHVAMRILANHHDTEDVLIIAYTRIFENIHRLEYRGQASLFKWMKTIVVNESIRWITSRYEIQYSGDMEHFEPLLSVEEELNNLDVEKIYQILETMPVGYRIVFNLYALEGYSHKEIGEMLQVSENTSKSQLRKARLYMIEQMKKQYIYGLG